MELYTSLCFVKQIKKILGQTNKTQTTIAVCFMSILATVALLDAAVLSMRSMDCAAVRMFPHLLIYNKCLFRPLWQVYTSGNPRELS